MNKGFEGILSKSQTGLNHQRHFPTTDVFLFIARFHVGWDMPRCEASCVFASVNLASWSTAQSHPSIPLLRQRWLTAPLFPFYSVGLSLRSSFQLSDHISQHPLLLVGVM